MRASIRLGIGTILVIVLAIIFVLIAIALYSTGLLPVPDMIAGIINQTQVSVP